MKLFGLIYLWRICNAPNSWIYIFIHPLSGCSSNRAKHISHHFVLFRIFSKWRLRKPKIPGILCKFDKIRETWTPSFMATAQLSRRNMWIFLWFSCLISQNSLPVSSSVFSDRVDLWVIRIRKGARRYVRLFSWLSFPNADWLWRQITWISFNAMP